jgi:hypothetical protein
VGIKLIVRFIPCRRGRCNCARPGIKDRPPPRNSPAELRQPNAVCYDGVVSPGGEGGGWCDDVGGFGGKGRGRANAGGITVLAGEGHGGKLNARPLDRRVVKLWPLLSSKLSKQLSSLAWAGVRRVKRHCTGSNGTDLRQRCDISIEHSFPTHASYSLRGMMGEKGCYSPLPATKMKSRSTRTDPR